MTCFCVITSLFEDSIFSTQWLLLGLKSADCLAQQTIDIVIATRISELDYQTLIQSVTFKNMEKNFFRFLKTIFLFPSSYIDKYFSYIQ